LVKLWQQVLAVNSISPTDNLFELGANSLAVMQVATLAQAKGLKLSVSLLIRCQTIRELVKELGKTQNLLQLSGAISTAGLCKDVFKEKNKILSLVKKYKDFKISDEHGAILLTGATGFLGSRLLAELLQKNDKQIYCLVRTTSIDLAKQKIFNQLAKYNVDVKTDNLVIIPGDLSKKYFGLSKTVYQQLASKIDVVYHCAALVNMVLPYSKLRSTNVSGTMEILSFVCSSRKKILHYASTLSVFVASDQNKGLLLEEDKLKLTNYIYGGYAQSKWVAEYLLHQANKELNTINFYRFGLLTGDSQSAYFPKPDFLAMFVKGISQLGCVPAKKFTKALAIDITPIDYAAKAMLEISVQPDSQGKIFHIANSNSLSFDKLIQAMQSFGLSINFVSQNEWNRLFTELKENQESEKLSVYLALCRVMSKNQDFERNRVLDLFQATGVKFSTINTELALKDLNLAAPVITEALLHKYLCIILGKNNNGY
jgi:thioester reductase-like protein